MNFARQLLLTLFLIAGWAGSAQSQPIPDESGFVNVDVGLFMIDVDEVNSVAQSFKATVYVELKWQDSSLAHDGSDSISLKLEDIWYPHTQILNQQRLVSTFPPMAEVKPSGEVILRQRVWGDFSQALELEEFPFDHQKLQIRLVNVGFGSKKVRYQINPESGIAKTLRIPDWQVTGWEISEQVMDLGQHGSDRSTVVLSMDVNRHTSYFTLKVILPLILIVAMSWMVFWIDPSLAASQISVAVTAMLTLIAYRFAIGGMVPRLGFMTSLDYFVIGSTLLVFMSLIEVVYTSYLYQNGQQDKARAVDLKARWIVPLIYAVVLLETLIFRIGI